MPPLTPAPSSPQPPPSPPSPPRSSSSLYEGHGEAKSLSIPVRLDAMDQTSSAPTASSMGQAISIPVNLNRMGSDGASSPKGSRGRSGSREEQRIAAAERYAANVSRGRGSPAAGARRVTPPEDDPRFKLVEGDDPDSFEKRQAFLLQRKASPGGSPNVKRHEFPDGGGKVPEGELPPPALSVISEPLSLEMHGKGGSGSGLHPSPRDSGSGAAGGGDSSTSSPLSGSVPGTASHPSPMPQPTSGSASFYKSPVSSPSGGAGSSSAADGADGGVNRTHSPERHRLSIQGPKTIALPELPKRREEDKNAEIRPNAELRVVDWDDLMTVSAMPVAARPIARPLLSHHPLHLPLQATGPKGVKFLGQGEYAVAFAVNLPARAKDQCGSPAEARAESFRRFANAEGNSTPGRVRRAPPRAGEAAAAGWASARPRVTGCWRAAPPGAPPPDLSTTGLLRCPRIWRRR